MTTTVRPTARKSRYVKSAVAAAVLTALALGGGTARADPSSDPGARTGTLDCGGQTVNFVVQPGSALLHIVGSTSVARLVTRTIVDTTTGELVNYAVFEPGLLNDSAVNLTTCTGRTNPAHPEWFFTFQVLLTPQGQ